jgi:Ca2+-transporting ATPase
LAVTHAYGRGSGGTFTLATKGAPEAIADLCRLDPRQRDELMTQVRQMAESGMRVLGIARGEWAGAPLPDSQRDFHLELLGLVGLVDPPRPEAPSAMATCDRAGIRVIMMTGDHPTTALAIARQVGLSSLGGVLTGADIDAMDDIALRSRLRENCVCARLSPEHKLRLVRVLQGAGETVGMTGDGVNDAPALKAADVGIAMGERGTDVAREAAALVLLDDSFASIVAAIRQGRRIDDNLRTAVRFIFAVHVPIIALALGPVLMHWPVLLLPAQIVLLELIIDPTCSILFEADPAAPGLMERPPRQAADSPFARANMAYGVFQGLGLAAILLAQCWFLTSRGWADAGIRTTAFLSLVPCLFLLVMASRNTQALRARLRNRWLPRIVLAVLAVLALLLGQPWLRQVMGFTLPPAGAAMAIAAAVAATVCWLAALRLLAFDAARHPQAA